MSSCDCNSKNRTPMGELKKFLQKVQMTVGDIHDAGIGVYVVPAPEVGPLEFRKVIVDNLSYKECILRGTHCVSFQWIPKGV